MTGPAAVPRAHLPLRPVRLLRFQKVFRVYCWRCCAAGLEYGGGEEGARRRLLEACPLVVRHTARPVAIVDIFVCPDFSGSEHQAGEQPDPVAFVMQITLLSLV